jgi:hypothetical protein
MMKIATGTMAAATTLMEYTLGSLSGELVKAL